MPLPLTSTDIWSGFRHRLSQTLAAAVTALAFMAPGAAMAAGSVNFTSPADGSAFATGTVIVPTGLASGTGTTGSGLDLVLVLDSSGSMSGARRTAQQAAAIALVNALPPGATSVSIVEFDSDANVVIGLTPLLPVGNIAAITTAINGVDASGGTNIPLGINAATSVLTGAGHTAGRSQQMVVLSDGATSGNVVTATLAAIAAGVDNVHSVALPGAVISTMQSIATNGNGTFVDFSDPANLDALVGTFSGATGSLVGVSSIAITLPDGTVINPNSVSGVGAFTVDQGFAINAGANTWSVLATFTDGSTATDTLTVYGRDGGPTVPPVPLPAGFPLLMAGLGGLGLMRLRRRK